MAKMAAGIADDLATTLILATDKPVMAVPAMNVRMWEHEATQRNVEQLKDAGVNVLHPDEGPMACGEFGYGRLPDPEAIWGEIAGHFGIEVEAAEPVAVPAPAANDEQPNEAEAAEDEGVEALEPEPEEETKSGGLGGLLSMIIPRSTAKRTHEEIEAEYLEEEEAADAEADAEAEAEGEDGADGGDAPAEDGEAPAEDEDIEFNPELEGSPLATKGGASSAPPTDPEAINHEVDDRRSAPRPELDKPKPRGSVEEIEEDALGGQAFGVSPDYQPLKGRHVLITAGPTWEALDPVRYIANRSSGKQGFAIAAATAALGAEVTLVAGPVWLKTPAGVNRIDVESAEQMNAAVKKALPADVAVMVAAVADWRPKMYEPEKLKKRGSAPPALLLTENPDILTNIAAGSNRPELVVGFAAETENVIENATAKRKRKAADWIIANDVSGDVMGGDENTVHIVSGDGVESLERMPKRAVALALAERIAASLKAEAAE